MEPNPAPSPSGHGRLVGRSILIVAGVALALLIAELTLWVAASFVDREQPVAAGSEALDVLCVGDSYTYGLGSEDGRGYPEHLQELLDQAWGEGAALVHNRGRPGQNSSQALDTLPEQLAALAPEVVVILVGHNNGWNYNDLHLEPGEATVTSKARGLLGRSRLVRLLRLAVGWDLGEAERTADAARAQGTPGMAPDHQAEDWFRWQSKAEKEAKHHREKAQWEAVLAEHPDDVLALLALAELAKDKRRHEEHQVLLERAREVDPQTVTHLQESKAAIEAWHRDQRARGDDRYLERNPRARAQVWTALGGTPDDAREGLMDRQQTLLDDVLGRDLEGMTELVRAQGGLPILMGYASSTKRANPVLEATARQLEVPYLDHRSHFDTLVAQGTPLADLFVLDGHCTSEGYRVMAEAVAEAIRTTRTGTASPPGS